MDIGLQFASEPIKIIRSLNPHKKRKKQVPKRKRTKKTKDNENSTPLPSTLSNSRANGGGLQASARPNPESSAATAFYDATIQGSSIAQESSAATALNDAPIQGSPIAPESSAATALNDAPIQGSPIAPESSAATALNDAPIQGSSILPESSVTTTLKSVPIQKRPPDPKLANNLRRSGRAIKAVNRMTLVTLSAAALCVNGVTGMEQPNYFRNIQFNTHEQAVPVVYDISEEMKVNLMSSSEKDLETPLEKELNNYSRKEMENFRYIHLCDIWNREKDDEYLQWTPIHIDRHYVDRKNKEDIHMRLNVRWLNGEQTWQRLDAFQVEHPELAIAYAYEKGLVGQGFFQWIPLYEVVGRHGLNSNTSNTSTEFKAMMASRLPPVKYKFGYQVPMGTKHALYLDKINENTKWRDAINKELYEINEHKTFRQATTDDNLEEYQQIPYHMVYDVKFDGRHKARLVCGGNHTDPPKEDIYSGVVGLDSMRLAFQVAAMNKLLVCAADVGTAFLYGKTKEKVYVRAGKEFKGQTGKALIIDKGLYGLRSSAARFHEHLAATIRKLGFTPSQADSDLYIRRCGDHYELLATYVDDLLVFSRDPIPLIKELEKTYNLKGVGEPQYYLGGDVQNPINDHWSAKGVTTALSAETYIGNVVERFERLFDETFKKYATPCVDSDHPELDDSPLLNAEDASRYRSLIGSANWVVTLGRFDVAYALQALARFSLAPRHGHFSRMKRVFGYLKSNPKGKLICDPTYPDHSRYHTEDHQNWADFYPDAGEETPPNCPTPLGAAARITCYVDADHAHCHATRRSVTGIVLLINNMPVRWISKRQNTVETSTYGSELVAARIAVDLIIEMRFALRMLGVPVPEPALLLGDNKSVVLNTTVPSSVLKKKHNAIAYHRIREAIAGKVLRFAHINTKENIADILTKPVDKATFYHLSKKVIFRVPVEISKDE